MSLKSIFIQQPEPLKIVRKLTHLAAIVVSVLTFASLFGRYPFLELTTHFRLQYLGTSLFCLFLMWALGSWKFVFPVLLCAGFNASQILPYYFTAPHRINTAQTHNLKLVSANLQKDNEDYVNFLKFVKSNSPDIIAMQEVTPEWWEELQALNADYPYSKCVPKPGGAGLAIFSRYPLESSDVLNLDDSTHPALLNKINLDGTMLTVLVMHPLTPMRPDKFASRNAQFRRAAEIMRAAPEPKFLAGDLNTTIWSPYFEDLVKNSGLYDARMGKGLYPSWAAPLPTFLSIPIDHCLTSESIEVETIETGSYTGSDHLPLIINLKIARQNISASR